MAGQEQKKSAKDEGRIIMPFTTGEDRRITDAIGPQTVGDRCFLFYREMLRAWRKSPRWTTAHELYRDMVMLPGVAPDPLNRPDKVQEYKDDRTAVELAWQVFFQLHVMPYELQKRTLNGEADY
jgi:hypothetical protein